MQRLRPTFVILIVMLAWANCAWAQPRTVEPDGPKSAATATLLSMGGTLASAVAGAAATSAGGAGMGVLVGGVSFAFAPSAGHWYVGKGYSHGLAMRLAGSGLLVFGGILMSACQTVDDGPRPSHCGVGNWVAFGGLNVAVVGAIYDWVDAGNQAREFNRRHHNQAKAQVRVSPILNQRNGHTSAGLALTGSF